MHYSKSWSSSFPISPFYPAMTINMIGDKRPRYMSFIIFKNQPFAIFSSERQCTKKEQSEQKSYECIWNHLGPLSHIVILLPLSNKIAHVVWPVKMIFPFHMHDFFYIVTDWKRLHHQLFTFVPENAMFKKNVQDPRAFNFLHYETIIMDSYWMQFFVSHLFGTKHPETRAPWQSLDGYHR